VRDPERIERILDLIRIIWNKYPDLRLGQLLLNAQSDLSFHLEDEDLEAELRSCYCID